MIAKHDMEAAAARFAGLSESQRGEIDSTPKVHSLDDAITWIEISRRSGRGDEHLGSAASASSEVFHLGCYPEISRMIEVMFYHFLRDSTERAPEMAGKLAETLKDPDQRQEISDALPREHPSNIDPFANP